CLQNQTADAWEWVVVDDLSDSEVREEIQDWFGSLQDSRMQLICNTQKSNASICRNIGADAAQFNRLVFLDADDTISSDFVANRLIQFKDFAVFQNYAII